MDIIKLWHEIDFSRLTISIHKTALMFRSEASHLGNYAA